MHDPFAVLLVATFSAIEKESGDGEASFPQQYSYCDNCSYLTAPAPCRPMCTHMSDAPLLSKVCSMQYIVEAVISRLNDIWYVAEKVNVLWTYTLPFSGLFDHHTFLNLRPLAPFICICT